MLLLPSGEVIDVADEHLELAPTLRCETGVHLNGHCVRHLSELPDWGPTLVLEVLEDRHGPGPLPRAPHPVLHQQHRRSASRRRAHRRRRHRHLPHLSLNPHKSNSQLVFYDRKKNSLIKASYSFAWALNRSEKYKSWKPQIGGGNGRAGSIFPENSSFSREISRLLILSIDYCDFSRGEIFKQCSTESFPLEFGLWFHMEKDIGAEKWSWFWIEITIMTYQMPTTLQSFCTFEIRRATCTVLGDSHVWCKSLRVCPDWDRTSSSRIFLFFFVFSICEENEFSYSYRSRVNTICISSLTPDTYIYRFANIDINSIK